MAEHSLNRSKRVAQRRLACEVLSIVHGEDEMRTVEAQHGLLFRPSKTAPRSIIRPVGTDTNPKPKSADINFLLNKAAGPDKPAAAGNVILPRSLVFSQQIGRVLYAIGLVSSRSEGHRLSAAKGVYIGSLPGKQHGGMSDHVDYTPALNWEDEYINRFIIDDKLLILRAGKWRVKIIRIVEDEEYEKLGLDAPGWQELKQGQQKKKNPAISGT